MTRLRLEPLSSAATAALLRERLGEPGRRKLCQACYASHRRKPVLLESLASALAEPGSSDVAGRVDTLGPQPVAPGGAAAGRAARRGRRAADACAGGPRRPRAAAARRCAFGPGPVRRPRGLPTRCAPLTYWLPAWQLEFAHPIVRAAIYESVPPGERALAHAKAALLLEGEGADAERVALHLLHSEPDGNPHVAAATQRGRFGGQRPRCPGYGRGLPAPRTR